MTTHVTPAPRAAIPRYTAMSFVRLTTTIAVGYARSYDEPSMALAGEPALVLTETPDRFGRIRVVLKDGAFGFPRHDEVEAIEHGWLSEPIGPPPPDELAEAEAARWREADTELPF